MTNRSGSGTSELTIVDCRIVDWRSGGGINHARKQSDRHYSEGAMRIFLTGGSGYIGSAVLDAFVRAGHKVDALVRNSETAAAVQARGGHPVMGDLSEPSSYADAAASADGVVHTAFEDSPRGTAVDATTIDTLLKPTDR